MAGESGVGPTTMPRTFDVGALSIHLSRQAGNAAHVPWEVRLSGAGGGSLTHDGKQRPFPYAAKDVVALLNTLYEIRFFDLPPRYSSHDVAQLRGDGTVNVVERSVSSATGNSVCVTVATFGKCVRYGTQAPLELDRVFRHVFADAQRLAGER